MPRPRPPLQTRPLSNRDSIRDFIAAGLCGSVENPASWGLIVSRIARLLPDMPAASVAFVLRHEHPDLSRAIREAFGDFDPARRKAPKATTAPTKAHG